MDTHADTHVAAALDPLGGLLGVEEFPATAAGYASLLGCLGKFGNLALVGVEGTGSMYRVTYVCTWLAVTDLSGSAHLPRAGAAAGHLALGGGT